MLRASSALGGLCKPEPLHQRAQQAFGRPAVQRPTAAAAPGSGTRQRQQRAAPRDARAAAVAAAPAAGHDATFTMHEVGGAELTEGDEVIGQIVWAGPKGAKVLLPDGSTGFMPSREAPYVIRDAHETGGGREGTFLPKGLVRPFKVIGLPSKSAAGGKPQTGPLLSARACDLDVLWERATQLCDVSMQHKENLRVTVEGANNGGLLSRLNGLQLFVPVSQLERKGQNEWWTEQDMAAHFTGKEVNLAVVEVVRASRKVVCSVVKAKENDDLRRLEVGSLVTGTVRRIEPFGVFVGINGTRVSGLLHISNVSRSHIETVQGVFNVGEQVKCLVMGLDPGYTNISLSIAELEVEDGDVLSNKQRVWDSAESQAAVFCAQLEEYREQGGYEEEEAELA